MKPERYARSCEALEPCLHRRHRFIASQNLRPLVYLGTSFGFKVVLDKLSVVVLLSPMYHHEEDTRHDTPHSLSHIIQ